MPKQGKKYLLPVNYNELKLWEKRIVREQYVEEQNGLCMYCHTPLRLSSPSEITDKSIDWGLFPPNFLDYPIHLQHDHRTGMTEGAVHAYCNAVMWIYDGR